MDRREEEDKSCTHTTPLSILHSTTTNMTLAEVKALVAQITTDLAKINADVQKLDAAVKALERCVFFNIHNSYLL